MFLIILSISLHTGYKHYWQVIRVKKGPVMMLGVFFTSVVGKFKMLQNDLSIHIQRLAPMVFAITEQYTDQTDTHLKRFIITTALPAL